jgi:hypothetical protein
MKQVVERSKEFHERAEAMASARSHSPSTSRTRPKAARTPRPHGPAGSGATSLNSITSSGRIETRPARFSRPVAGGHKCRQAGDRPNRSGRSRAPQRSLHTSKADLPSALICLYRQGTRSRGEGDNRPEAKSAAALEPIEWPEAPRTMRRVVGPKRASVPSATPVPPLGVRNGPGITSRCQFGLGTAR